jgi:kynurenine formamidase
VAGWVLAVCSMVSRPCSCQTSAKSFRKPCENAVRLPTGRPFGLPETPGATSGRSHVWSAQEAFVLFPSVNLCAGAGGDKPGLSLEAAQWLVEDQKAMLLGADNLAVERFPSSHPENFVPVHSYLLVERGVSIIEALWLEDLSKDGVYEFLFIASPLKFRGGTASPIRPLAISLQR